MEKIKEVIETLSPDERKVLPYLKEKTLKKILKKSKLNKTKVLRALQFLGNKDILELKTKEIKLIDLGDNGVIYLRSGLPERRLLNLLSEKKSLALVNIRKETNLSENELKAAIGALKKKAMIELSKGKIILKTNLGEVGKKSFEEQLIESLPLALESLNPEQKLAYDTLKERKNIVEVKKKKQINIKLTEFGKQIISADLSEAEKLIETLTPEMIKTSSWKGKRFRRFDIKTRVPEISGGKRHFVNQAIEHARKIWLEMGFKEMIGSLTQTGFWNFDALFTAQDHPVRELHDTFYIEDIKGNLPDKKIVQEVKKAHEQGVGGSKGWQYSWKEDEAEKIILRTHTTCLSAQQLSKLKNLKDKQGKYFAIGRCFRNETLDWSHGFEFYQTEGIVVDKEANFRHLLGYLKEYYKKMGFEKIRFTPAYFPYTEPSVEISVWHPEKKVWLELGGAGVFRPELTIPLLGKHISVLAWGQGFDRTITDYYQIKDLRELYKNNLTQLRKMKFWI